MITVEQAREMGAHGGPVDEHERLLFEAWMAGHCWMLHGDWTGETYVHEAEKGGYLHPGAMLTRQLWAAWRDRAGLNTLSQPAQQEPVAKVDYEQRDGFRWLNYLGWQRIPDGTMLYTRPQREPLTEPDENNRVTIDRACFDRGCACFDPRIDKDAVIVEKRS